MCIIAPNSVIPWYERYHSCCYYRNLCHTVGMILNSVRTLDFINLPLSLCNNLQFIIVTLSLSCSPATLTVNIESDIFHFDIRHFSLYFAFFFIVIISRMQDSFTALTFACTFAFCAMLSLRAAVPLNFLHCVIHKVISYLK